MKTKDLCLAVAVAMIWGLNFSFIKLGVAEIDPLVLAGLRFALTAVPLVCWLPRPAIAWRWLMLYGLLFGVGTWGAVSLSIAAGLSPGLAAWLQQSSAFITPMIGFFWLREAIAPAQKRGSAIAILGFVLVVSATAASTPVVGLALVMMAAVALSVANLVVKRAAVKPAGILGFVAWSCLFAPLPLFALAAAHSGSAAFTALPSQFNAIALASLLFQVYPTTLFGYWVWNSLMARYSTAEVAPIALLVPIFALLFSWIIFRSVATMGQTVGISFILLGLMTSMFYQRLIGRWRRSGM